MLFPCLLGLSIPGILFRHPLLLVLALLCILLSVLWPTCISGRASHLTEVVKAAVIALRQIVNSLELALGISSNGAALASSSRVSEPSDWDVVSEAATLSENQAFDQVAQLLTKAPPYCLELASKLGKDREERVQHAWEAGLWAKAVLEGKLKKPRPSVKIPFQAAVYIVLRGPGVDRPIALFLSSGTLSRATQVH